FERFENLQIDANGTTINLVKGGNGPPILMLHGYPQTHAMWNKIAPRLAEDFTVVCPDLRGYGDSAKVEGDPDHINYSKRVMAQDQVDVMQSLGFEQFYLVGHDRGGRVSHRLTKDHPDNVLKLITLDIIPTRTMFQIVNKDFATNTYHWFFLIQPYDFPERVIGADPEFYAGRGFNRVKDADTVFTPEALNDYLRCFNNPGTIHAVCEDYRAGASIDLVHDDADFEQKVNCPMLAMWSSTGYVGRTQDVLKVWQDYATDVRGKSLTCGHYIAEEMPDEAYAAIKEFLSE
ncbi:MAG: alpha/beta hydrolase, partial [Chloroflexota bacterium]|nr:alpha/beta hydrolase [Chloroflexota bacterium]